ncbi:Crp/Fnr family transcriptional regulator [Neptunomonas qingdaonensis]|nr:cyclic nucleotide-binding domain-containing protein [Neptunomonas qingdaonensis]
MQNLTGAELIEKFGIDYFHNASTLGALSNNALTYLLENGIIFQLDKGDQLFAYDSPGDNFFVVLKGTIQFYKAGKHQSTHIRNYQFGQEIGSVAMIGLHNRVGDAFAGEDSIALKISCSLFHSLHETFPTDFGILLLNLSREMARRLRECDDKLANHNITH